MKKMINMTMILVVAGTASVSTMHSTDSNNNDRTYSMPTIRTDIVQARLNYLEMLKAAKLEAKRKARLAAKAQRMIENIYVSSTQASTKNILDQLSQVFTDIDEIPMCFINELAVVRKDPIVANQNQRLDSMLSQSKVIKE